MRGNVGVLLVKGNNVVSIGYNGPPSGEAHCSGNGCATEGKCHRALHAERNAIERYAMRTCDEVDLYTTSSPCIDCARLIITRQVRRVFFRHPYRLSEGVESLKKHGVPVFKVNGAGYVIDDRTGDLIDPETL